MSRRSPLRPFVGLHQFILPMVFILLVALNGCRQAPAETTPPPQVTAVPTVAEAPTDAPTTVPTMAPAPTKAPTATPTPEPTPVPPLAAPSFVVESVVPIAAGEPFQDAGGINVVIPEGALDEGVTAQLTQLAIDPAWQAALSQQFTMDTPFVSLAVDGLHDARGKVTLRLPAASPDSRLVAIIDETYFAVVDVPPQDGFLETAVALGSAGDGSVEQVGSLTPGGSLHFSVLTPLSSTGLPKGRLARTAWQNTGGRTCGIQRERDTGEFTYCRQNNAGTVQVTFHEDTGLSKTEGEQVANAIAEAMAGYAAWEFSAAQLNASSPMRVVVVKGSGDPYYRSINGVIYLPVDVAKNLSGGANHDMLHEMAHWIQDEAYNMAWAFWSGGKTWWIETAAENMVMLHDAAYIPMNLTTYGTISTDDNILALQQTPYQWPADFYAHAQLVKVNMCNDAAVCPLSSNTFVKAINEGTYPFDAGGARAQLSANLDAYARYLLGASPGGANGAMPLGEPVSSGDRYGEYIQVAKTNKGDYQLSFNGYAPQMQKTTNDLGDAIDIAATIQKDGVYPLVIASGIGGRSPGLPTTLTIQPGAPFWYRLGDGEPQFHDGGSELILAPVHQSIGVPGVRLVAMGKQGGETFRARLALADLQGSWVIVPGEVVADNISCENTGGEGDSGIDRSLFPALVSLVGVLGEYRPDPGGNSLTWQQIPARIPAEAGAFNFTFRGAALPGSEDVKVQAAFTLPGLDQSSRPPTWPQVLIGVAIILPGAWGLRGGRRRPYWAAYGLLVAMLILGGCFVTGFDMWGTVSANMQFDQVEYLGAETVPTIGVDALPDAPPLWLLKGTADYEVDFSVKVTAEDDSGEESALSHCTGTATYQVEARVYEDLLVDLE